MAIHFVSSADGNNGNSGHTLDLAWATLEYALESGSLVAGDTVAIRRTHSEIPTSDIVVAYNGTFVNPIVIFGCPRDTHAISSSDWTNGNTSVNVDDNDMDREQHQGRYITAPDGETYLITRKVPASNTIILDREYAGTTQTNQAATIQADDVESDWENYNDSADTIKKSGWESDADDLALIDFNDGSYQINCAYRDFLIFKNIEFKDSGDGEGILNFEGGQGSIQGCLIKQTTQNAPMIGIQYTHVYLKRTIIEGSGSGGSQFGIGTTFGISGSMHLKDCAIYNCGDNAIRSVNAFLENVNLGVEIANGDDEIGTSQGVPVIHGRDVKLGGSNGYVDIQEINSMTALSFENYQKILGAHRTFFSGGFYEKVAIAGETPNAKVSTNVIKITPNINQPPYKDYEGYVMLQHEIEMTAASHTLRYWIYNDTSVTLNDTTAKDNIYLKAEYVKAFDDTSEYVISEDFSTEIDILDAADADDWDSLQVTITTATAGKVRLTIYLSFYSAAGIIFIDPAVVIT